MRERSWHLSVRPLLLIDGGKKTHSRTALVWARQRADFRNFVGPRQFQANDPMSACCVPRISHCSAPIWSFARRSLSGHSYAARRS